MNLKFGGCSFIGVTIPLLWGKCAVIAHADGQLSIIDLSGQHARLLVLSGKPAIGVEYSDLEDGFEVYDHVGKSMFFFSPVRGILRDSRGGLPECSISSDKIMIGTNVFKGGTLVGFPVGVGVEENGGFYIGGQVPPGLAPMVI